MTITDAQVEAAARGICRTHIEQGLRRENAGVFTGRFNDLWMNEAIDHGWEHWTDFARAALEAAERVCFREQANPTPHQFSTFDQLKMTDADLTALFDQLKMTDADLAALRAANEEAARRTREDPGRLIAEAYRAGQESMREQAANLVEDNIERYEGGPKALIQRGGRRQHGSRICRCHPCPSPQRRGRAVVTCQCINRRPNKDEIFRLISEEPDDEGRKLWAEARNIVCNRLGININSKNSPEINRFICEEIAFYILSNGSKP